MVKKIPVFMESESSYQHYKNPPSKLILSHFTPT